jgi:hypothetical protein
MSLTELPVDILTGILAWIDECSIDECLLKQSSSLIKWVLVTQMGRHDGLIDVRSMFNHDLAVVANRLPRITVKSVRHDLRMTSLKSGNVKSHEWLRACSTGEYTVLNSHEVVAPIQYGHLDCLKYILGLWMLQNSELSQFWVNDVLVPACEHGQIEIAKYILSLMGVAFELNAPFQAACRAGHLNVIQLLYSLGANIHASSDCAFQQACKHDHYEVVQYLYSIGADIHAKGERALRAACEFGNLEIVKLLHSLGADIHIHREACFISACGEGHLDVVKYLYSEGLREHARLDDAMREASQCGELEIVKFLYAVGADIHADDDSAIIMACDGRNLDVVRFLHAMGANIHAKQNQALRDARYRKYTELILFIESLDGTMQMETTNAPTG